MTAGDDVRPLRGAERWVDRACGDGYGDGSGDVALFFDPELEETAVALCWRCPIRLECLDWALRMREDYGVWGGLTERERRVLRYAKRRVRCPHCGSMLVERGMGGSDVCIMCGLSWKV